MTREHIPVSLLQPSLLDRRSAARIQLRIPAKLVSLFDTHDCVLIDVSRSGALVRLARPLAIDACGYLHAGPFEAFAITVRVIKFEAGDPISGIKFDTPLTREQLLELRSYPKEYAAREKRSAMLAADEWFRGVGR
ncbi:MAG: PilZ domain-containing protein [Porphyrobacter sp.]|nr:PilZ domain-containing protein [Porphyrobacter sp.]